MTIDSTGRNPRRNPRRAETTRTISEVPFLAPDGRSDGPGTHSWDVGGGRSIVRCLTDSHVSLLQDGEETATLTVGQANTLGHRVYTEATEASERLWGQALCSAATLGSTPARTRPRAR